MYLNNYFNAYSNFINPTSYSLAFNLVIVNCIPFLTNIGVCGGLLKPPAPLVLYSEIIVFPVVPLLIAYTRDALGMLVVPFNHTHK